MKPPAAAPASLLGVDFSAAPSRRKPITAAWGRWDAGRVQLVELQALPTLTDFEALLARPGPWTGAFDFPFGLPREFVESLSLGAGCDAVSSAVHQRCPTRMDWRRLIDGWGNTRPAGRRLLHRATDTAHPAASTSPMQTRYVPVGFMYYEGFARVVAADLSVPSLRHGDPQRVALEGYPARLAHAVIGRRSYKNDDSSERRQARRQIVDALEAGTALPGLVLALTAGQRRRVLDDAAGDHLDAVVCLMQAAWAAQTPRHGLPERVDPVEGWIVGPEPRRSEGPASTRRSGA